MKLEKKRILNAVTVCVTVLAIIVGGNRLLQMATAPPGSFESEEVADWRRFSGAGHRVGPSEAPVVIVEFLDFTCPYCQEAAFGLELLRDRYSADVAVVYRHLPSDRPNSLSAAVAAECAARFGRFIQFHDALMARRGAITANTWPEWAEHAGIPDTIAFVECMAETTGSPNIQRDTLAARELGVQATPTFLINNRMFRGYPGFDRFHDVVREAIREPPGTDQSAERSRSDGRRQLPWGFESVWRISSSTHESLAANTFPARIVISPDGELVDSLGRTGGGPGEFGNAIALDVTADSILTVTDYSGRLVRWRVPDGQLLDPVQLEGTFNFGGLVRTMSDGLIATEMEASSGNRYAYHVTRSTSAGTERVFMGRMSPRNRFAPCGRSVSYPKLFEPRISWDYNDGMLAVAEDSLYVVHLLEEGTPPVRIERDVLPRPVTASMARRELGGMAIWAQITEQCGVSLHQVLEGLGYSRYLQAVADVRVSPSGEIWALRAGLHDEPQAIDVFSGTGEHLGTLPPGSPFPAAFAPPNRIVAIGYDEFGPTLTAYRMSR